MSENYLVEVEFTFNGTPEDLRRLIDKYRQDQMIYYEKFEDGRIYAVSEVEITERYSIDKKPKVLIVRGYREENVRSVEEVVRDENGNIKTILLPPPPEPIRAMKFNMLPTVNSIEVTAQCLHPAFQNHFDAILSNLGFHSYQNIETIKRKRKLRHETCRRATLVKHIVATRTISFTDAIRSISYDHESFQEVERQNRFLSEEEFQYSLGGKTLLEAWQDEVNRNNAN